MAGSYPYVYFQVESCPACHLPADACSLFPSSLHAYTLQKYKTGLSNCKEKATPFDIVGGVHSVFYCSLSLVHVVSLSHSLTHLICFVIVFVCFVAELTFSQPLFCLFIFAVLFVSGVHGRISSLDRLCEKSLKGRRGKGYDEQGQREKAVRCLIYRGQSQMPLHAQRRDE